ncbi:hypothetical protein [Methyloglobulus sp.]|uniref:hypothetical protein n=1 Tax=Methyloglobulus sp. TaxID=2518622 RepID=UPI00398937E4
MHGIPPEQLMGNSVKTKFELRDGKPVIVRLPKLNFIDNNVGKPVGKLQMPQWTAAESDPRF